MVTMVKKRGDDEQMLEGGGAGGGAGAGFQSAAVAKRPIPKNTSRAPRSILDESERVESLEKFRRNQAFKKGETEFSLTDGKKTVYPYVAPVEKKKGGKVSASTRADGCASRGKTKGRMV
jgi:hypothetical protein